jgi:putative sugar O-methyltransferase
MRVGKKPLVESIEDIMIESVEIPPKNESAIVSSLMTSFRDAKRRQDEIAGHIQIVSDWEKYLESQWRPYYKAIDNQDLSIIAPFLRNFFRNEGISGFWGGEQMFETFANLDKIEKLERANLMRKQFEAWRAASPNVSVEELNAPLIGNPWGYIVKGNLLYEPICEYHYQANYFARLLNEVPKPVIIEIGGGFGGLAYQIVKSISYVKYIGFDLPENIFLQSYYLSCAFPKLKILTYYKDMTEITQNTISKYDIILLPDFMIKEVESYVADLIINIRSFSEMPVSTIEEYYRQIDRLGHLFFFHENLFKDRLDGLYGIPSPGFPALKNFILVTELKSWWPRYQNNSAYPCHEYLYIHGSHRSRLWRTRYKQLLYRIKSLAMKVISLLLI